MENLNMKVYRKMLDIVEAHPNLLTSYKNDLHIHDFNILENYEGDLLYWNVYDSGTNLVNKLSDCEVLHSHFGGMMFEIRIDRDNNKFEFTLI